MRLLVYGTGCYVMGLYTATNSKWVSVLIGAWIGLGALMFERKKKS